MRKVRKLESIPEILYETPSYPGEKTSPIPYMVIPKEKDGPLALFVHSYHETGEDEIGANGRPEPIMDGPYPHMYVEFEYMFEAIAEACPDVNVDLVRRNVRVALGLKPTAAESKMAGEKILEKVEAKASELQKFAEKNTPERQEKIKASLEKKAVN
jgi:hypothetical protein